MHTKQLRIRSHEKYRNAIFLPKTTIDIIIFFHPQFNINIRLSPLTAYMLKYYTHVKYSYILIRVVTKPSGAEGFGT